MLPFVVNSDNYKVINELAANLCHDFFDKTILYHEIRLINGLYLAVIIHIHCNKTFVTLIL